MIVQLETLLDQGLDLGLESLVVDPRLATKHRDNDLRLVVPENILLLNQEVEKSVVEVVHVKGERGV